MRKLQTEVLVIGGGATGAGILRDLAMRGFRAILVERRDLTDGTTGRFHGLLHSGARYAVKDPEAARECIEENRILRRIMPDCIEDTGGFFVLTPGDDPTYVPGFLAGCRQAGIPAEEVSIRQMLASEPRLNPKISRCFRVPDAAVDGFAAARANAASARAYGAQVLTYHEVVGVLTGNSNQSSVISNQLSVVSNQSSVISSPLTVHRPPITVHRSPITDHRSPITGVLCRDLQRDELVQIRADLVINAAGAWAGKIGALAGVEITMRPGKGTLIAVAHRVVHTVINRLHPPSDGDILVPAHTVAVMGTTDIQVPDPDRFAIEPWEVELLLREGEQIIPGFSKLRILRAWAGVRPLYQETAAERSRDITRSFVLLDHEERDGVSGLLTITGGKWTTYRKMAELTVDKVCEKLGTARECRTHLEPVFSHQSSVISYPSVRRGKSEERRAKKAQTLHPPPSTPHPPRSTPDSRLPTHHLGTRLARIEREHAQGDLICECELVTRQDVIAAIERGTVKNLDDLRRELRLGMGPCQGGFCTLRAAGIWEETAVSGQSPAVSLLAFLQERWKGLLPVLWGDQLRQERLNELIYVNVLNAEHLPEYAVSREQLSVIGYQPPDDHDR